MKKQTALSLALAGVLSAYSMFVALDTFVLSRSYADAGEMNTALFHTADDGETEDAAAAPSAAPGVRSASRHRPSGRSGGSRSGETAAPAQAETPSVAASSDDSYRDENISLTLTRQEVNGTAVYVADVTLTSAEYLKTALADDSYGKNITDTTSRIAGDHDAILAVNGDYYGVQERGYVIRNGVLYRSAAGSSDVLCLYADGRMEVVSPEEYSAQELLDAGVWQAWSFGPGLVEEGEVTVSAAQEVGRAMASNPRTAIGMIEPGHYVFVVSDGRTGESEGLTLRELAEFMESLGCETAYNLDGGGSSTMVFLGRVVNNPTTTGNSIKEREVSDIVYIG
ncbi:MAG: phosphodiester glycosidase family protein [Oscillospiraceae bacterium]|nr:phosphodiester glycosidase family protein [Oscillospiraceae bacterium]